MEENEEFFFLDGSVELLMLDGRERKAFISEWQ